MINNSKLTKLFNICQNKKLNNFDFFFTKLSGIDPYEKRIDYPGGHAWGHVFMACSKLEAMTVYLVKHTCGNDILASV